MLIRYDRLECVGYVIGVKNWGGSGVRTERKEHRRMQREVRIAKVRPPSRLHA